MIEIFYYENKKIHKGTVKDLKKLKDKKIWVDILEMTAEEEELIKKTFKLHPLTSEDLFSRVTRIKVEEFPNYLFCVFYGIQKNDSIELVELDFVLGKNFLITNCRKEIESFEHLKNHEKKLKNLFVKGTDFLFHRLLDAEVDNFFVVLDTIDDDIEEIEEGVTKKPTPELLSKILKLKRLVVLIKKSVMPQREKLSFLTKNDYPLISKKAIPYFRDIYDHSIRVSDTVDNYRDAMSSTFDAYMSSVSNSMNEVMKVLSIIATIALPLTVVSGIYGTNFLVLPGSTTHYGFWIMISFMVIMSVSMLYYFRRRGWF